MTLRRDIFRFSQNFWYNAELRCQIVLCPRLRVFKTEDDITLKISDRGGGIPRRRRGKIFNYMYSTAPKVHAREIVLWKYWVKSGVGTILCSVPPVTFWYLWIRICGFVSIPWTYRSGSCSFRQLTSRCH